MPTMAGDRHLFKWWTGSFVWILALIQFKSTIANEAECSKVQFNQGERTINPYIFNINNNMTYTIQINDKPYEFTGQTEGIPVQHAGFAYNVTLRVQTKGIKKNLICIKTQTLWTKPEKPGYITMAVPIPNPNETPNERMFNVTFIASQSNVSYYTIKTNGSCNENTTVPSFICGPLVPHTKYSYTITAYNGNHEPSKETKETFTTDPAASSNVMDVKIHCSANNTVIEWKPPQYPNGHISNYSISVKAQDSDHACIYCFRCSNTSATNEKCQLGNTSNNRTCPTSQAGGSCDPFSVKLLQLRPNTDYNISISAVNEAGPGNSFHETCRTEIGVASNVNDVQLTSMRNQDQTIDLTVTWTAGPMAGPTTYNVTLNEQPYNTSSLFISTRCTDQNETWCVIKNVKAFWDYKAQVLASTVAGDSRWISSQIYRTVENNPGVIQNVTLVQNATEADRFTVKFPCLPENERNGTIKQYIVRQALLGPNNEEKDFKPINFNAPIDCPVSLVLTGLKVESNYTLTVRAKNYYEGNESAPINFTVHPQKFNLLKNHKTVSSLIRKSAMSNEEEEDVIKITVCAQCLLNSSQGSLQNIGLLVCVIGENNRCNNTEKNYTEFGTWAEASATQFTQPYRTTEDKWLKDLQKYVDSGKTGDFNFTIGDDSNCATESKEFCNGPLPESQTITVSVIACTTGDCDILQSEGVFKSTKRKHFDAKTIIKAVLSTMVVTLLVCFGLFMLFWKKPAFLYCFKPQVPPEPEITLKRPVKLREFEDHVVRLHKDSNLLFQDEFEQIRHLCMTFKTSCNEAQREANRIKNRYVDILPYDHSRVKLDVQPEDDETNDFINANYIPGKNSVREYIATQGPMHCTVPDFWQMAWEQKCHIIVMLSDLQEGGKLKVDQYWPENLNEPLNFENVIVEVTNFSQLNKYIIRNFRITKGDEVRKVIQFFLPGWWDFSANLNFDDVLEFVTMVRQAVTPETGGPIIVHCSAGVGRTGTLIALDYFMQYVDKASLNDEIDIFNYVLQMRKNRPRMVQAESQYIFIFDAIREVIKKKIAIQEGRLLENQESSPAAEVEAKGDETTTVNMQVCSDKCVYNNAAFEPEDAKKVGNEMTEKSTPDQ